MKSLNMLLLLICVLGSFGHSNGIPISDNKTAEYDGTSGQTLLDMGTKFDKPLLRLIGKSMMHQEEEMEKTLTKLQEDIISLNKSTAAKMESGTEKIFDEMCRLHPCTEWSNWTACPATKKGRFSMKLRTRMCGYNSTLCESTGESKTETMSAVCEGVHVPSCPDTYNYTKNGFCLKLSITQVSKPKAESICQEDGGHIVNLNSPLKADDIHAILKSQSKESNVIWLDGQRKDVNSAWEYLSGSEPQDLNWVSGEPTNGNSDLCMVEYISNNVRYRWDTHCSQTAYFICDTTSSQ